jgi:hypothetical protein
MNESEKFRSSFHGFAVRWTLLLGELIHCDKRTQKQKKKRNSLLIDRSDKSDTQRQGYDIVCENKLDFLIILFSLSQLFSSAFYLRLLSKASASVAFPMSQKVLLRH